MARIDTLTNFLTDVSNAIKQKTGDNAPIPASQFDTEILSIETVGNYQEKQITITENGTFNLLPDTGYDALSNVRMTVDVEGGTPMEPTSATQDDVISPKTFYSNGQKLLGSIIPEYQSDGSAVDITTPISTNNYYVFDYLPNLQIGIIATSVQPTSCMLCKFENGEWNTSNAITISKASGNANITCCKFGGCPTALDNNENENVYNIIVNGKNGGSYDDHYFRLYRVNLDTWTIIRNIDNINYFHSWWTTGESIYNITANPKYPNQYYMMLVNSYRQSTHGCIRVTVTATSMTFAEQNTGGLTSGNSNAYCRFSTDGEYVSWYYNGTTLGRVVKTYDNTVAYSGWGMHAIFNIGNTEYVFRNYDFYNLSGTKLTNYGFGYFPFTYAYCYVFNNNILVLINTTNNKMMIYSFDTTFELSLLGVYDNIMYPTYTSWEQCRLGYFKGDTYLICNYPGTILHSITSRTTDIIKSLTRQSTRYQNISDAVSTADKLLLNETMYNYGGKVRGTMPNNGAIAYTPSTSRQNIANGYHNGSYIQPVTSDIDINIIPENIRNGATILGVNGTYTGSGGGDATSDANLQAKYLLEGYSMVADGHLIAGTMRDYGNYTITATSNDITIPEGHYNSLSIPIINAANCTDYTACNTAILSI